MVVEVEAEAEGVSSSAREEGEMEEEVVTEGPKCMGDERRAVIVSGEVLGVTSG